MDKTGNKDKNVLDIVLKILAELKIASSKEIFLTIVEKMLDTENCSASVNMSPLQIEVAIFILQYLKNSQMDNYDKIFQDIERLFMPRELKMITKTEGIIQLPTNLGEGDFGNVFLGVLMDSHNLLPVALKVAKNSDAEISLLSEAKVLARLNHKNVVKILAFQKNPLRSVMEYMKENLRDAVKAHRLDGSDILRGFHNISSGMVYISGKKYIHRDLFPQNILVDSNKVCKIGDFGDAKYVGFCPNGEYQEQQVGRNGKFHSYGPETLSHGVYSRKTDVFAFGIMMIMIYHEDLVDQTTVDSNKQLEILIKKLLTMMGKKCIPIPNARQCPVDLQDYVRNELFKIDPRERPHFPAVEKKLGELVLSLANQ